MKLNLPPHLVRAFVATSAVACTIPCAFAQSTTTVEWDERWGSEVLTSAPSSVTISDETSTGINKPNYSGLSDCGSMSFTDSPFVTETVGETPGHIAAQFAASSTPSTPSTHIVSFDDGRVDHEGDAWYNIELGSITGRVVGGGSYTDTGADGNTVGTYNGDVHIQVQGSYTTPEGDVIVPSLPTYTEEEGLSMVGVGLVPTAIIGGSHLSAGDNPHSSFTTNSNTYITVGAVDPVTQIVGANFVEYSYGAHAVARRESVVEFNGDTHIRVDGTVKIPKGYWDPTYPGYAADWIYDGTPPVITGSHYVKEESDASEGDARGNVKHTGNTYIDIVIPDAPEGTYSPLTQSVLGSMYVTASSTDTVHKGDTHVNIDLGGAGFYAGDGLNNKAPEGALSQKSNFGTRGLAGGGYYASSYEPRSAGTSGSTPLIYNEHIIDGNTNLHLKNVGTIWEGKGLLVGGSIIQSGVTTLDGANIDHGNKCTITGKSTLTIDGMQTEYKLQDSAMGKVIVAGGHYVETTHHANATANLMENSIHGGTLLDINDTNYFGTEVTSAADYIASVQAYLKTQSSSSSSGWKYDESKSGSENLFGFLDDRSWPSPPAGVSDLELIYDYAFTYYGQALGYDENIVTGGSYIESAYTLAESSVMGDITVKLGDDDLSNGKSVFYKVHGGSIIKIHEASTTSTSTHTLSQGNVNVHIESGADVNYLYSAGKAHGATIVTASTTVHVEEAYTGDSAYGIWSGGYEENAPEYEIYSSVVTGERAVSFSFASGTDKRGASEYFDFVEFDVVDVKHAAASADFSSQDLDQLNGRSVLEDGATRVSGLENAYGADTNTVRKTGEGSLILGATNGQQKGGTLQLVVEQGRVVLARDSASTTQSNFQTLVVQQGATLDMRAGHYDSVTKKYTSGNAGINGDLRLEVGAILQADASRDMTGSGTTLEGGSLSILGEGQVTLQFTNLDLVESNQVAEAGHLLFAEGSTYFEIVLFSGLDYAAAESTNLLFDLTGGTFDGVAAMGDLASKYFDANFILDDVYVVYNANGDVVLTGNELIIPEPSTATLSLLSLAGLLARRRRRRA